MHKDRCPRCNSFDVENLHCKSCNEDFPKIKIKIDIINRYKGEKIEWIPTGKKDPRTGVSALKEKKSFFYFCKANEIVTLISPLDFISWHEILTFENKSKERHHVRIENIELIPDKKKEVEEDDFDLPW